MNKSDHLKSHPTLCGEVVAKAVLLTLIIYIEGLLIYSFYVKSIPNVWENVYVFLGFCSPFVTTVIFIRLAFGKKDIGAKRSALVVCFWVFLLLLPLLPFLATPISDYYFMSVLTCVGISHVLGELAFVFPVLMIWYSIK